MVILFAPGIRAENQLDRTPRLRSHFRWCDLHIIVFNIRDAICSTRTTLPFHPRVEQLRKLYGLLPVVRRDNERTPEV